MSARRGMILHRAAWVLPVSSPPVRDGWVAVEGERVAAAGGPHDAAPPCGREVRWSAHAILPGLTNAHTHLELSWMRGQVPPAESMPRWVERLMALRRTVGHEPPRPIEDAVAFVRASGTALVGDISNTLASHGPLYRAGMHAHLFRELLGFRVTEGEALVASVRADIDALPPSDRLRTSIVPHAPYSVSPALMVAIAAASRGAVLTIHLAESAEEVVFLRDGSGAWRGLLERLNSWDEAWTAPGCGPVEYIERFGLVDERLVAVHGVQLADPELERLARAGATVVTCPRSNRWTGAGRPPVARFYAAGVRVAVGTDSLASVEDLNLFAELAAVREEAPGVPARRILESATRGGAEALGFGAELGTIESGKRAELLAVKIPPGAQDVEEYLLSGIGPDAITWLNGDEPENPEPER